MISFFFSPSFVLKTNENFTAETEKAIEIEGGWIFLSVIDVYCI